MLLQGKEGFLLPPRNHFSTWEQHNYFFKFCFYIECSVHIEQQKQEIITPPPRTVSVNPDPTLKTQMCSLAVEVGVNMSKILNSNLAPTFYTILASLLSSRTLPCKKFYNSLVWRLPQLGPKQLLLLQQKLLKLLTGSGNGKPQVTLVDSVIY